MWKITLIFLVLVFCQRETFQLTPRFRERKLNHTSINLSRQEIITLSSLTDIQNLEEILDNICIERVVGSPGHNRVKNYIKTYMKNLGWDVESDKFTDDTPIFKGLVFENIIARLNSRADRYLVLACHYDSKYMNNFIGATDSAVPCAQMMNLAFVMQDQLNSIREKEVSLMLLFLDGEEAFYQWGPTDSIYGARNLASKWENVMYSYDDERVSELDKIDLFILLDLIGAPDPTFYNYFPSTSRWYSLLSTIENSLAQERLLINYSNGKPMQKYFQDRSLRAGIEDDHVPFLRRNVPILHLIPYPFPDFWHTIHDKRENIDLSTIENINKMLRTFVAAYLHVKV